MKQATIKQANQATAVTAALGYGSIAFIGVWLIRNGAWSPALTLTLLIGLFVLAVGVLAMCGQQQRCLQPVPVRQEVNRGGRARLGR